MRKYLTEYIRHLEELLSSGKVRDYEELLRSHLTMIQFMQHERLVHFLVTMLFAVCFFIILGIYLALDIIAMGLLLILVLALLIPYVLHYYFLENSVQKMYMLHDEINARRLRQKRKNAAHRTQKGR